MLDSESPDSVRAAVTGTYMEDEMKKKLSRVCIGAVAVGALAIPLAGMANAAPANPNPNASCVTLYAHGGGLGQYNTGGPGFGQEVSATAHFKVSDCLAP